MKARFLLTVAMILTAGYVFSQNLVLSHEGEPLEPNAQITVEGSSADPELIIELAVTNTGSATIDVLCKRYELSMVPGTMSAICWGGLCYPPNTSLSAYHTTIGPGITIENDFSGHYYPQGQVGVSTIAFTFFDMVHPNDSVMITILFDGLTVGVNEAAKNDHVTVFPNPADDFLTVELNRDNENERITFQLIDVNGAIVSEIVTGSSIKIDTGQLAEGIYMYRALVNNQLVATDKIIVKH